MEEFTPEQLENVPISESIFDTEKKKIKEGIEKILGFSLYDVKENSDSIPDPREFWDKNPSTDEINSFYEKNFHLVRCSTYDLAQLCFVIIGEQPAYDGSFIFDDEKSLDDFLETLKDLGVKTELIDRSEILGKLNVRINFARNPDNLQKIKEVEKYIGNDIKKYDREYGKLMGFPDTAVGAFIGESERLSNTESHLLDKNKYPQYEAPEKSYMKFAYSKDHADEEHAYFLKRNNKLKEYAPQLFK